MPLKKLNIACWITASRLALLPGALLPLSLGWRNGWLIAASICALAGASDAVDGYIARRRRCVTPLGAWLDLASDKLFVSAMMGFLVWLGVIPLWVLIVVVVREVVISVVRLVRFRGRLLASDVLGKVKMAAYVVAIVGTLLRQDLQQGGVLATSSTLAPLSPLLGLAPWIMYLAVALTVLSGVKYLLSYGVLVPVHKAFFRQGAKSAPTQRGRVPNSTAQA